jgi:hypothetical protein
MTEMDLSVTRSPEEVISLAEYRPFSSSADCDLA